MTSNLTNLTSFIIKCPHCFELIEISSINCGIFRHGQWVSNGQQLNPHATQEECEAAVGFIYGCGKPFKIVDNEPEKCNYE